MPGCGPVSRVPAPGVLRRLAAGLLLLVVTACEDVDIEKARDCERLVAAFGETRPFEVIGRERDPSADNAVIIRYRSQGAPEARWISCRFGGEGFDQGRRALLGVSTDHDGALSGIQLEILKRFWLAQDGPMAAPCGIDVGRTVALSFALAGAYAAAAGFIITLYYGGASFHMGALLGFKALTAAIVGGIGSVPGAFLGGILIGLLETFWSAYLTIAYKDVAIFALLALVLVFRPNGLLGRAA